MRSANEINIFNDRNYRKLGDFEDPGVIGDGSNYDCDALFAVGLFHEPNDARQGNWRPVDFAHEETPQDDLVEFGVGASSQEAVKLFAAEKDEK